MYNTVLSIFRSYVTVGKKRSFLAVYQKTSTVSLLYWSPFNMTTPPFCTHNSAHLKENYEGTVFARGRSKGKVGHENWYRTVSYSILTHRNAKAMRRLIIIGHMLVGHFLLKTNHITASWRLAYLMRDNCKTRMEKQEEHKQFGYRILLKFWKTILKRIIKRAIH
jgi:hypothetical protein